MPGLWSFCYLGVKKVIKRLDNSCRLYILFLFCFPGIRGTFKAKSESWAAPVGAVSHGQQKPYAWNPSETAFNVRKTQVNKEISNEFCHLPCVSFYGLLIEVARILRDAPQNLTSVVKNLKTVEINDHNTVIEYFKYKFS